jgi:hypothetical protein
VVPEPGNLMSVEFGPSKFMYKITNLTPDFYSNTQTVSATPLEDTIRPVALKFPSPLRDLATDPKGFDYHWETLTYLFDLSDPAGFVFMGESLAPEERVVATRFVETCRNLAQYSILSGAGSLSMSSDHGAWSLESDLPSHEAFAGFSVTFRQLHNNGDEASFSKVFGFLNKAVGDLGVDEAKMAREILSTWKESRAALMNKMAATIVCERLRGDIVSEAPLSFEGVKPDEIIVTYNYGDSLHWGKHRERLAQMTNKPFNEDFYKHACIVGMLQLSHFYFGFAELVASALGYARVTSSA